MLVPTPLLLLLLLLLVGFAVCAATSLKPHDADAKTTSDDNEKQEIEDSQSRLAVQRANNPRAANARRKSLEERRENAEERRKNTKVFNKVFGHFEKLHSD